ncbi:A/G-specific adenine glycosylase [Bacillus kwashiorkori]|uniref:A/G-specific adenine glycosylase n=1 Tax=Bacillus kwashiorkori TaxID=1522318 RepID=UPI00078363F0|nr:A/G-specific adenine glycosylase [Bacillus kwashiorkori]
MLERITTLLKDFNVQAFQNNLIEWYEKEHRDLPWRKTDDPYKIWVSEIMLQQTKVDTVIPYYEKFLIKYPTVESLANADEQELLKVWEGLGYYSRARNLQTAVREVQEKYDGIVPNTYEQFSKLKGVGPYTAGAVLSIAYGIPEPAVDGNVMRVLSRVFLIEDDIAKTKTRKLFESLTKELISEQDPSSFNQGMMELGAIICTPTKPSCLLCPVRESCQAYKTGNERNLPNKTKPKKIKTVQLIAAILLDEKNRALIRKRPSDGLLANLWEFPNEVQQAGPNNMLTIFEEEIYAKHQVKVRLDKPLFSIEHVFSHLKWEIAVFVGKFSGEIGNDKSMQVISFDEIETYPFPVSHQKIWQQYKAKFINEEKGDINDK